MKKKDTFWGARAVNIIKCVFKQNLGKIPKRKHFFEMKRLNVLLGK